MRLGTLPYWGRL